MSTENHDEQRTASTVTLWVMFDYTHMEDEVDPGWVQEFTFANRAEVGAFLRGLTAAMEWTYYAAGVHALVSEVSAQWLLDERARMRAEKQAAHEAYGQYLDRGDPTGELYDRLCAEHPAFQRKSNVVEMLNR